MISRKIACVDEYMYKNKKVEVPDDKRICCCKEDFCFGGKNPDSKGLREKLDNIISSATPDIDPETGKEETSAAVPKTGSSQYLLLLTLCGASLRRMFF